MPLVGFTKLLPKLLDGSKTQTIRKPRKHPIHVGDTLYLYWKLRTKQCHKLGEGIVTNIEQKTLWDVTDEDARKDGFKSIPCSSARTNLIIALATMHPNASISTLFDIITWRWTKGPWTPPQEPGL